MKNVKTKKGALIIALALLCYMMLSVCISFVFLRKEYAPDISGTYSIAPGEVYTDDISANGKYLKKIDIGFALFDRAATYLVKVRLTENEKSFYETVLKSSDINDHYEIELFSAKKLDPGNTYKIELTNITTGNENPVTVNISSNGEGKESSLCVRKTYEDVRAANILRVISFLITFTAVTLIFLRSDVSKVSAAKMITVSLSVIVITFILTFDLFDKIEPFYTLHIYGAGSEIAVIEPGETKDFTFGFGGSGFDSLSFICEWEGNLDLKLELKDTDSGELIWEGRSDESSVILPDNYATPSVLADMGVLAPKGTYDLSIKNESDGPFSTYLLEDGSINLDLFRSSDIKRVLALLITFIIAAYVFAICLFKEKIFKDIRSFFIVSVIPLGLCYFLLFTPSSIPDNHNHFPAVYRYSNILMLHGGDEEWSMRSEDLDLFNGVDAKENGGFQYGEYLYRTSFFEKDHALVDDPEVHRDFMKYYSIFGYLPQVIGLTLARLLRLGGAMSVYLARAFIFAFSVFAAFNAIKKTPVGKGIFALVSLVPITLMMDSGFSYDSMVFAVSISFTACILALKKDKDDKRLLIELMIWAFLLGAVKGGGGLLILPLIILLFDRDDAKTSIKKCGLVVGCSIVSVIFFNKIMQIGNHLFQFGEEGNEFMSTSYALRHPVGYLKLLFTTYIENFSDMTGAMLGTHLSWLEYVMPILLLIIMASLMGLYSILEKDELILKSRDKYILMIPVGLGLFITPMMLLSATYVGWPFIQGVQGRYYLALLIPVLLILTKFSLRIVDERKAVEIKIIKDRCLLMTGIISAIAVYYIERSYLTR